MSSVQSFPPIVGDGSRVLILGSMPGRASLLAGQYYAHSRNAFWPLMEALLGIDCALPYARRCDALGAAGIALWDVLQSCTRSGSLDSAIVESSIVSNDFAALLRQRRTIAGIFFNGAMAERSFKRYVLPDLGAAAATLPRIRLPSTSPAHASLTFQQKLEQWRQILPLLRS
ncbi:MAG: DNA-deoxyinosine glycosylase [Gammaproteobacteria bacterium]|nr:DNA-deoxyinosine glycosylase [Gammaproteobacteria bacterium]